MATQTVKLMIGTNDRIGTEMLNRDFKGMSWWSDNLETLAHYYEGRAIEITVKLDFKKQMKYFREFWDLVESGIPIEEYTYGFITVICPKDAVWYSFSADYLKENVIEVKEIFPDLSEFYEE